VSHSLYFRLFASSFVRFGIEDAFKQ